MRVQQTLSPKDVALALGVSESSLKRWSDSGRIAVARTAGGHRRIPVAEVVRFAREADLPILRPDMLGLPDVAAARRRRASSADAVAAALAEKLRQGEGADARAIVLDLYLSGRSIPELFDGPVRYAMERVGELWQHDPAGVFVEHRATDLCIQAVQLLRTLVHHAPPRGAAAASAGGESGVVAADAPGPPVALGGAPSGDPYALPSLMASTTLAALGFQDVNLGPDTPLATLVIAAEHHRPRLVWLACSATSTPLPPAAELDALAERLGAVGAPLVLGGRAAPRRRAGSTWHPNLHTCATMSELSAFAKGVLARPGGA